MSDVAIFKGKLSRQNWSLLAILLLNLGSWYFTNPWGRFTQMSSSQILIRQRFQSISE
jgi:hypothetical protein